MPESKLVSNEPSVELIDEARPDSEPEPADIDALIVRLRKRNSCWTAMCISRESKFTA